MILSKLSQNETTPSGLTHKVTIEASDLTAAATSQNIPLINLEVGALVRSVMAKINDTFVAGASTSASSVTVSVGTTDSTASLMTATELDKNSSNVPFKDGTGTRTLASTAAIPLVARFSGAANLSTITNGSVDIFLGITKLKNL
jgi:hypothetical protein